MHVPGVLNHPYCTRLTSFSCSVRSRLVCLPTEIFPVSPLTTPTPFTHAGRRQSVRLCILVTQAPWRYHDW